MYRFFSIILMICLLTPAAQSQKTVNNFINKIKKHRSAVALTLPGWFIRKGIDISTKGIDDQDEREIVNLGKKIKKLRFVIVDKPHHISVDDSNEFLTKVKEKDGFEEYTRVRDGNSRVYVLVKEEKGKIKYLTIYARGESNVAVVSLKTELTFEELDNSNFSWKQKDIVEEDINN